MHLARRDSVLIVEDDPSFRRRVVDAVLGADDLVLAGEAGDLATGMHMLAKLRPSVLLTDIGLPGGSGIRLIRQASELFPACDVIVVTVFGDAARVIECVEAGAVGYLLKDASRLDIVEEIRTVRRGGSAISPLIARQLMRQISGSGRQIAGTSQIGLSNQEVRVLEMSSKGYTYEEIAGFLALSRNTVETYVKRIYRKLQVHSKTEAVYEARKLGLMRD